MKVTFIHHSSFFLEQEKACFLFDYWKGTLPEVISKPLFIFVSHGHKDHFNPVIFDYGRKWKDVSFIISNDIDAKFIPSDFINNVTMVKADEKYIVSSGGVDISFSTLNSTDIGVAYLIDSLGKKIFFAGDLHLWIWREDEEEDRIMKYAFEKEIEKIRGLKIDVAFLPLDPRQEKDAFLGLDYIARVVDIKHIYPMHCWQKFSIINKLFLYPCSEPYRNRVSNITKDGYTDEI